MPRRWDWNVYLDTHYAPKNVLWGQEQLTEREATERRLLVQAYRDGQLDLTDQQQAVLDLRAQGRSFAAIGEHFGISRERARQMEAKARQLLWGRDQVEAWIREAEKNDIQRLDKAND